MSNHETVTVGAGESRRVDVSDGETLSGVLYDCTADGAGVSIVTSGDGWEVSNVGVKGTNDLDPGGYTLDIAGNGLVDTVYAVGWTHGSGGIRSGRRHGGHIDIRRVHFEGFSNNGMYCSGAGKPHPDINPQYGTVSIGYCFCKNNTVSQFRIGTDGSEIFNSVGVVTPEDDHRRPGYAHNSGAYGIRGVWSLRHSGEIRNSHIVFDSATNSAINAIRHETGQVSSYDPSGYPNSVLTVSDSEVSGPHSDTIALIGPGDLITQNVGASPSEFLPAGCPADALEAATGSASGGFTPPEETITTGTNNITIRPE